VPRGRKAAIWQQRVQAGLSSLLANSVIVRIHDNMPNWVDNDAPDFGYMDRLIWALFRRFRVDIWRRGLCGI
jgi:hypothetical protein